MDEEKQKDMGGPAQQEGQGGSVLSRVGTFLRQAFGGLWNAMRKGMDMMQDAMRTGINSMRNAVRTSMDARTARVALRNNVDPFKKTPGETEAEAKKNDERYGSRESGSFFGRGSQERAEENPRESADGSAKQKAETARERNERYGSRESGSFSEQGTRERAGEGPREGADGFAEQKAEAARERNKEQEAENFREYSHLVPGGFKLKEADAEGFYTIMNLDRKDVLKVNGEAFKRVMAIEGFSTMFDSKGTPMVSGDFSKAQQRVLSAILVAEQECSRQTGGYAAQGVAHMARLEGDMVLRVKTERGSTDMLRYLGDGDVVKIPGDITLIRWSAFAGVNVRAIILPEKLKDQNPERFASGFKNPKYRHSETVIINNSAKTSRETVTSAKTVTPAVLYEKIKDYCRNEGLACFREADVTKVLGLEGLKGQDAEILTDACRKELETIEKDGHLSRSGDEWRLTKEPVRETRGETENKKGREARGQAEPAGAKEAPGKAPADKSIPDLVGKVLDDLENDFSL